MWLEPAAVKQEGPVAQKNMAHNVSETPELTSTADGDDPVYDGDMFRLSGPATDPLVVPVHINSVVFPMEVGASVLVISEHTYEKKWTKHSQPALQPSQVRL